MKCYKVVTKDYKSTIVQDKEYLNTNTSTMGTHCDNYQILDNRYCVKYEIGKLIKSYNNTPLFCFKTLKDALNYETYSYLGPYFVGKNKDFIILECEGFNKVKVIENLSRFTNESMLDLFYRKNIKNRSWYFQPFISPPEGTICFKKIKPIKEVKL